MDKSEGFDWGIIEEAHDTGRSLRAFNYRKVNGGFLVGFSDQSVYGLKAFLPSRYARKGRHVITEMLPVFKVKILEFDKGKNNIVVSAEQELEEEIPRARISRFIELSVGDIIQGRVVTVKNFGVFVSLGAIDGLLPLKNMDMVPEEYKPGMQLRVLVEAKNFSLRDEKMEVRLNSMSKKPKKVKLPKAWKAEDTVIRDSERNMKAKDLRKHIQAFVKKCQIHDTGRAMRERAETMFVELRKRHDWNTRTFLRGNVDWWTPAQMLAEIVGIEVNS